MTARIIDVINKSGVPDATIQQWIAAVQIQINRDVLPAWAGICDDTVTLSFQHRIRHGNEGLQVVHKSSVQGAEGYHIDTRFPLGFVAVDTTTEAGDKPSATFSHEVIEQVIDPTTQAVAEVNSVTQALEACDAVEETGYQIDGVDVSNFQFPAWFQGDNGPSVHPGQYDYMDLCNRAGELLPGGYVLYEDEHGNWQQQFAEMPTKKRLVKFSLKHRPKRHAKIRAEKLGETA
jgi:hypothetical protein